MESTSTDKCSHGGCEEARYPNLPVCILHDPNPEKDRAGFNLVLQRTLKAASGDPDVNRVDLTGIQVPNSFSWNQVWDRSIFEKAITWRNACFHGEADFRGAVFDAPRVYIPGVDFSQVEFKGRAHFESTEFKTPVFFLDATFFDEALFPGAHWAREAGFNGAKFISNAYFIGTHFDETVGFNGAHFYQKTDFMQAEFHKLGSFHQTRFGGETTFQVTRFAERADFRGASFESDAHFLYTQFQGRAEFESAQFPISTGVVSFQDARFEQPESVFFQDINLSRVSFLRTDVSDFRFIAAIWPQAPQWPWVRLIPGLASLLRRIVPPRSATFDELNTQESTDMGLSRYALVAELCAQLRRNYEYRLHSPEAGDFFIGQMEMQIREKENRPLHYRFLLWIYGRLALYGESYLRPLLAYLLVSSMIFPVLYLWAGINNVPRHEWGIDGTRWIYYWEAWFASITAGGFLRSAPSLVASWGPIIVYSNMVVDITLITFSTIALRRRFKR